MFTVAGLGERLDEGVLLLDRPAAAAGADGDGFEGNDLFWFLHMGVSLNHIGT